MNSNTYRFSIRSRGATSLVLSASAVLGLLSACSSDSNPTPSKPPVISAGGGGYGGSTEPADAGESSVGGSAPKAGSGNQGGGSNGGSGGHVVEDGGAGGEGGGAGEGAVAPSCPTTDEGFLNQPSDSQKSPFDNNKRLGAAASLPPLP